MEAKFLVFSCLVLCLGAALAQRIRPGPIEIEPIRPGPIRPGPPSGPAPGPPSLPPPDLPIRPPFIPFPYPRRCSTRNGGWKWTFIPQEDYPTAPANTIYAGCKVWRPQWSSCQGSCHSYHNITSVDVPVSIDEDCKCCQPQKYYTTSPRPYCLVIRINFLKTPPVSWRYEYVQAQLQQHRYVTVGRCSCLSCGDKKTEDELTTTSEEVDENDRRLTRPPPPVATEAEEDQTFAEVARENPTVAGFPEIPIDRQ